MLKTCMAMQVHCAMFFTFNLLLKPCTCFLGLLKNCTCAPICERLARRQPRIGVNDSAMVSKLIEPDPSRNCCTCIQTLIWYILTCLRESARNVHTYVTFKHATSCSAYNMFALKMVFTESCISEQCTLCNLL